MDDYFDLGPYARPVTTTSPQAAIWFNRGLLWRYAFNHEEAVRCYERSAALDPACAMAHWGIAYASGPYYNKPWADFTPAEVTAALADARRALANANAAAAAATPLERALIGALGRRYPASDAPEDLQGGEDAYAAAMREVCAEFPDDPDSCALFAEALMNRTPWQLWDPSGEPAAGADTLEAVAVLERAMRQVDADGPLHPGLLHLYIHAMEMSPHPERALRAADALRGIGPDAGHFQHMPSHIDILCGDYRAALAANERAIVADRRYVEQEGAENFYTLSRCHDYHFKIYAAMLLGQYRPALQASTELAEAVPEQLLRSATQPMADWLEGFVPMKAHVLVRFGKWQELLDEQLPHDPDCYPVTTATLHYAKGVAHAVRGETAQAEAEQRRFEAALAGIPPTRKFFNNLYIDILAVAADMLAGEIEYRKGNHERAFDQLRSSVARCDSLPYDEPWGWMQPPRHALGALLLEQDRAAEALEVYRVDLGLSPTSSRAAVHPDNVWGLIGYVESLHRLGEHAEAAAAQRRLDLALARADPEIQASCFCRTRQKEGTPGDCDHC